MTDRFRVKVREQDGKKKFIVYRNDIAYVTKYDTFEEAEKMAKKLSEIFKGEYWRDIE